MTGVTGASGLHGYLVVLEPFLGRRHYNNGGLFALGLRLLPASLSSSQVTRCSCSFSRESRFTRPLCSLRVSRHQVSNSHPMKLCELEITIKAPPGPRYEWPRERESIYVNLSCNVFVPALREGSSVVTPCLLIRTSWQPSAQNPNIHSEALKVVPPRTAPSRKELNPARI